MILFVNEKNESLFEFGFGPRDKSVMMFRSVWNKSFGNMGIIHWTHQLFFLKQIISVICEFFSSFWFVVSLNRVLFLMHSVLQVYCDLICEHLSSHTMVDVWIQLFVVMSLVLYSRQHWIEEEIVRISIQHPSIMCGFRGYHWIVPSWIEVNSLLLVCCMYGKLFSFLVIF